MPSFLTDPDHWRERAAQARAMSKDIDDIESRRRLLVIADGYDGMAVRAEARAAAKKIESPSVSPS
jgi:hypothetical protein